MTKHKTGTREEWRAARLELLAAEKELTHKSDELARRRQELPWVCVDKPYQLDTDEGRASLADLFRGRSQLLVYHFMFGPEWTAGCPACSSIADGFDGFAVHLENHDVTLTAVSRAPLAKLQAYKGRMGWSFPWASSFGSDFNHDFQVGISEEQQRSGVGEYNYRAQDEKAAADPANAGAGNEFAASATSASAVRQRARSTVSRGPKDLAARRKSSRARPRSPSWAIAIPRSARAAGSSRRATRLSAPSGSPARSARPAAVIEESTVTS